MESAKSINLTQYPALFKIKNKLDEVIGIRIKAENSKNAYAKNMLYKVYAAKFVKLGKVFDKNVFDKNNNVKNLNPDTIKAYNYIDLLVQDEIKKAEKVLKGIVM